MRHKNASVENAEKNVCTESHNNADAAQAYITCQQTDKVSKMQLQKYIANTKEKRKRKQ